MEVLQKVNYSLVALGLWLISIILFFLVVTQPDAGTRSYSFSPLFGVLLFIVLLASIIHLILRTKKSYRFKGKVLAIILIVLAVVTFLFSSFFMARTSFFGVGCHTAYKNGYGCEQVPDYYCSHYSSMGFGQCDACETLICSKT